MSSTFYKTVLAGAIAAGALLLPATSAQAAGKFLPCDGPGIGSGFIGDDSGFDDGFGFGDEGIGFGDEGFGDEGLGFGDGIGFLGDHHHRRNHDHTTVIVVTVPQNQKTKHHHSKPAATEPATAEPDGTATDAGAAAGYAKPSAATATPADGYRQAA